ncbi:Protein Jade-1 [Linum perenne]
MMGRGPGGGCGTGEMPCRPNCRVTASNSQAAEPEVPAPMEKDTSFPRDVDFFSQARKALCERSPFDAPEDVPGSSALVSSSLTTLPSGLASLLRHSESRKKRKKSYPTADKKSSRATERSKGANIWLETEDYFREVALEDIDALFQLCSSLRSLAATNCFSLPYTRNFKNTRSDSRFNQDNVDYDTNLCLEDTNGMIPTSEVKDGQQHVEIDNVGVQSNGTEPSSPVPPSDFSGSVFWVLGCRNRNLLTSERPSKKRKLLGSDGGFDKVLIGSPCEGDSSTCDFCCKGNLWNDSDKLIVCSSCNTAVHGKCYGVQGDVDDPWLCSKCMKNTEDKDLVKRPCLLCPKQGGASKPVGNSDTSEAEFVHLFCSVWMPEVYVEDLTKMEPIVNLSSIKDIHKKLVCKVCKVKFGTCIRCSHGTCRAAFHPRCAREAKHRLEVWGKYGHDTVELRAFCSKHSGLLGGKSSFGVGERSLTVNCVSVAEKLEEQSSDDHHKIHGNGDKCLTSTDKSSDIEQHDLDSFDSKEEGDAVRRCDPIVVEKIDSKDPNLSGSLDLALLMKKLIHRGKINMKDVSQELDISPDSLDAILAEDRLVPEVRCKIIRWLHNHAYMGSSQRNVKAKLKPAMLAKVETCDFSEVIAGPPPDFTDTVAVKSVPLRRKSKNKIKFCKNDKPFGLSKDMLAGNGMGIEFKVDQLVNEELEGSSKTSTSNVDETRLLQDSVSDSRTAVLSNTQDNMGDYSERCSFKKAESTDVSVSIQKEKESLLYSDIDALLTDLMKMDASSINFIHPCIQQKLLQIHNGMFSKSGTHGCEGIEGIEMSRLGASSDASVCCHHESKYLECNNRVYNHDGYNSDKLFKADELGIFPMSPSDEVEGEIIYFQHKLLSNAVQRKHFTGNLVCNLAANLPTEIDAARKQNWEAVLVNQYIYKLREAKKLGRKEKRHKEAQAILAAATAAAAASSRTSSLRKDAFDECSLNELNVSYGRPGVSSQLIHRPKETLSRVALPRISSQKYSDAVQSVLEISKEHPRSCDICRRSETILNPILVCSSCKVAVHLDCYRNDKESSGPWHCELCEDLLSSKHSGGHSLNFWEKPHFVAECGLCGGATGAFRKCINGQWVHAFCAEWLFQSVFRRGQVNLVEGMDELLKEADVCCVCRRKHGACVRCSYGNCQATFHPTCARTAGFYMNVKFLNGKFQHKAYCEKHSVEPSLKAESQKHSIEELKSIKQIRVELERLRLLCERIIKREKLKARRDLVICSHNILASKRDDCTRSALVENPFFHPDVSSESATTSLKGNVDCCSDAIQRSDEITVDGGAVMKRIKVAVDSTEEKTDDSSTCENALNGRPAERQPFAGKQIPRRSGLSARGMLDDGDLNSRSKKQRVETLQKELVMTSDQASMRNQQLPKGYFYIPVDRLPKEKQNDQETNPPGEPLQPDG